MNYKQRLHHLVTEPRTYCGFSKIIYDILILEEKINCPSSQSEYFRMGMDMHQMRLEGMKGYYYYVRSFFNETSVETLQKQLDILEEYIKEKEPINPKLSHFRITANDAKKKIEQFQDYIQLKLITDELPTLDDLKDDNDLLLRLLG